MQTIPLRPADKRFNGRLDSHPMPAIVVQLDAAKLDNPDLDIRYVLPDLLVSRAGGLLSDDGYDCAEDTPGSAMLLFLETDEPDAAVPIVVETLKSERVVGNDLSNATVAVLGLCIRRGSVGLLLGRGREAQLNSG